MTETVTVTPGAGELDDDGNPTQAGAPYELTPLQIAPGNTTQTYGVSGELEQADFTVYFPLGIESQIADGYLVDVRGHKCTARVRVWRSSADRGGVEVLCRSATGASGG